MICPGRSEKRKKLIPSKKNQSVLIAKVSSRKIQKIANPQMKINARKSFVAHDIGQNQFEMILTIDDRAKTGSQS